MSKKANPRLIGSFVVGGVALALLAVFLLGGGIFRERVKCVSFFDGSVKGLSVGAPVAFRGVRVGTVTDIQLRLEGKDLIHRIPVFFEIEPARLTVVGEDDQPRELKIDRLIERGLSAQLAVQSFVTGLLMIELDFRPGARMTQMGSIKSIPEIPTVPSDLESFLRRFEEAPIEELLSQVTEILKIIRGVLESPDFEVVLRNFRDTLAAINLIVNKVEVRADPLLNEGALAIQELRKTLSELNRRLPALLAKVDTAAVSARNVAGQLDRNLPTILEEMEKTVKSAQEALQQTTVTLDRVGETARDDSPFMHQLNELAAEVAAAARSMRVLADYLQQHPEALLRGKRP